MTRQTPTELAPTPAPPSRRAHGFVLLSAAAAASVLPSCARVQVDPIEVKPIHIVMDVNIRVDRELDQFFAFEEQLAPPATQATTQPAVTAAGM